MDASAGLAIRAADPRDVIASPVRRLHFVWLAVTISSCAWFNGPPLPARVVNDRLVDTAGISLYTFDRDIQWSRQSRCLDECAKRFPPALAPAAVRRIKEYGILVRPDGTRQWTFQGKPLYRFVGDTQPGDTGGEGDANLWRLARP
jgi:predicted lipoprotein with Yx(FWY)xxD motif